MDPGSALAVTSLVFQLFGGCIKGFVLLNGAHNAGKVGSSLVCMLNIQEYRLTEWAKRAGLLAGTGALDPRLNGVAVQTILSQLYDLLGDVEKLSKRYRMTLTPARPKNAEDKSYEQHEVLGIPISEETRKDILWRAKLIQEHNVLPKRLWWAAVDRDKFLELVADVRVYVQDLWNLLDPITQDDLLHQQQLLLSQVISIANKIEDLKALQDAIGTLTIDGSSTNDTVPLANIAALKAARLHTEISRGELTRTSVVQDPVAAAQPNGLAEIAESDMVDFRGVAARDDLGIARYSGRDVLIERKDIPSQGRSIIFRRIQQLAHILHVPKASSFRTLHCLGVALDDQMTKAAFVFELPLAAPMHIMSLRDLLGGKSGLTSPSVGARIKLATRLLQSIQYFHTAGWMHKNLRSENIQFFSASSTEPRTDDDQLEDPYIVGFAFSRLDAPAQISERPSSDAARDIYRHPHSLSGSPESYQRFMDLYSLGTMLVELAEWRPLSTIVREVIDVKKEAVPLNQIAGVRSFLCKAACSNSGPLKLEFRMGKKFARAARVCLGAENMDGEFLPEGLASSQSNETLDILNTAVDELRACVI